MTRAKVRKDLIEQELCPPLWDINRKPIEDVYKWINLNDEYDCLQPDAWDGEEANLLLVSEDGKIYFAMSIDFNFNEEE